MIGIGESSPAEQQGGRALSGGLRPIRGVYLWAGRATIDLNQVKFPDMQVDEKAHLNALTPAAAAELASVGFDLAFLSMNWGFPPEREVHHWREYQQAVAAYHAEGIRVLGYVQSSNCLAAGSYRNRDWYAVTPRGERIAYFRDRLMTCWNHPEWIREVESHAVRAVEAGADGVFFDNIWMGSPAWSLGGTVAGFAGCACVRCRDLFRAETGLAVPTRLSDDPAVRAGYVRWRSELAAARLRDWADAARAARPGAITAANVNDAMLRDIRSLLGIDLERLQGALDILLVENIAMPRFEEERRRLVANALPLKALQARAPRIEVAGLTYETGIGLDGQPAPSRAYRAVAESVATGASPVVKGTEYLDSRYRFTVMTCPEFRPLRKALTPLLQWIDDHRDLFAGSTSDAEVGILLDRDLDAVDWEVSAPLGLAIGLLLIRRGIPFRYVDSEHLKSASGLTRLLVPEGASVPDVGPGVRVVVVGRTELGIRARTSLVRSASALRWADLPIRRLVAAYFRHARVRRLLDGIGLTAKFLESSHFSLPPLSARMNERLRDLRPPAVDTSTAVLVERRRAVDGSLLVHLVNYTDSLTPVDVDPGPLGTPELLSPDRYSRMAAPGPEAPVRVNLDRYAVLRWRVS
ncbi:MAG: putative glycoside hydrolase family 15 protein [marine benthic group bacterium]|nr:putative glycoside hydrolase family 15 protein [Candidatus Benthicola marisminoris]